MFIVLGVPNQEEVKESGREKRKERRKIHTPFSWFVLISGTDLVLACRSDSESYYGFGS